MSSTKMQKEITSVYSKFTSHLIKLLIFKYEFLYLFYIRKL